MLRAMIAGVDSLGMPTLDPTVPKPAALIVRFVYAKGGYRPTRYSLSL
jgi:hypothetical protein